MSQTGSCGRNRVLIPVVSCLICLCIPLAQYYFRRFDDNTYTSLHLIFLTASSLHFFLVLIACVVLSLVLLGIRLPVPYPLFLFFGCFLVTAFFWSMPEVNMTVSRYFTQAKHLELYGVPYFFREWGHGIQAWMDSPGVPFFDGLIFKIFGESRIYIQLFTSILFGTTAVITYLIGKELWDEEAGFYGGLLLLGVPYLVIQTPLTIVDVPTMFFLTLSIYLYIRAVERGGLAGTIAAAVAIFIAAFCKYSVWPMLSILPVISLVYYFKKEGRLRRQVLQTTLWVFLLSLILVGVPVLLKFDVIAHQIELLFNFQRRSLGRWTETWASIFLFQTNPLVTIAAACSLLLAAWKRDHKYLIVLWLPFLIVFFQLKRVRYILPVFPMLTLMAAYGLTSLRNRNLKKVITVSVVVTSLATCFFLFLPFFKQWSDANLKDAGQFLDTLDVDAVEVVTIPQKHYPINPAVAVPLLDLFTQKRILYHYVPGASTPDEDYHTSRFRDSWEYQNPPYYEDGAELAAGKKAVAVIFANLKDKIPAEWNETINGLQHTRSFTTYYPYLASQTLVRIYW